MTTPNGRTTTGPLQKVTTGAAGRKGPATSGVAVTARTAPLTAPAPVRVGH